MADIVSRLPMSHSCGTARKPCSTISSARISTLGPEPKTAAQGVSVLAANIVAMPRKVIIEKPTAKAWCFDVSIFPSGRLRTAGSQAPCPGESFVVRRFPCQGGRKARNFATYKAHQRLVTLGKRQPTPMVDIGCASARVLALCLKPYLPYMLTPGIKRVYLSPAKVFLPVGRSLRSRIWPLR